MNQAFICDAVRTPIGRYGGALAGVRADDLGAAPLQALFARHPQLDCAAVDDILDGCANQAGEDNRNVARMSALLAGLPIQAPDTTIGWRFPNPRMKALYDTHSMPQTADNVAAEFAISRADPDAFAWRSQQRWAAAD